MAGRRLQLARLLMAVGAHRFIAWGKPASLIVINYHRIRAPGAQISKFDDGVFDTDSETFRHQMKWLQSATNVLDEKGLLNLASGAAPRHGSVYSLVTFDDGYIDCYSLAKPVLDELGIRGIFFIPVEMLKSRLLGWWDLAAYMLKKSKHPSIVVNDRKYELGESLTSSLKRILDLFKLEEADRTQGLLEKLSAACEVSAPTKSEQSAELMDWTQVCQLHADGHSIGSHAWSHRVLATLDAAEQAREIRESRRELQAIVGGSIASFAYPVGGPQHYNRHSVELVREAGYEAAFTFNTGITTLPIADRFQIPRESASSLAVLKAKSLLPRVIGIKERRAV